MAYLYSRSPLPGQPGLDIRCPVPQVSPDSVRRRAITMQPPVLDGAYADGQELGEVFGGHQGLVSLVLGVCHAASSPAATERGDILAILALNWRLIPRAGRYRLVLPATPDTAFVQVRSGFRHCPVSAGRACP